MKDKRKVVVYKYEWEGTPKKPVKVIYGNGIFHQFGIDFEELETGTACYSTAIVEMPDGSVKNVPVELIVFNN